MMEKDQIKESDDFDAYQNITMEHLTDAVADLFRKDQKTLARTKSLKKKANNITIEEMRRKIVNDFYVEKRRKSKIIP